MFQKAQTAQDLECHSSVNLQLEEVMPLIQVSRWTIVQL